LQAGDNLDLGINLSLNIRATDAKSLVSELQQILNDLGLSDKVRVEHE